MKFENESTYKKFAESGNESEFDKLFDDALDSARRKFGNEYPMKIGKQDVKSSELIVEASPIDRKIIIGNKNDYSSNRSFWIYWVKYS